MTFPSEWKKWEHECNRNLLSKTHCTVTLYFDHASRLSFIKRYKKLEISGMLCGKKQWIKTCALPSSLNLFIEFSLYKKVNTKLICLILRILGMSGLSFTTKNYITWKIQKLEIIVLIVDGKFSFLQLLRSYICFSN